MSGVSATKVGANVRVVFTRAADGTPEPAFFATLRRRYSEEPDVPTVPLASEAAWLLDVCAIADAIANPMKLTRTEGGELRLDAGTPAKVGTSLPTSFARTPRVALPARLGAPTTNALEVERRDYAAAVTGLVRLTVTTAADRRVTVARSSAFVQALIVGGVILATAAVELYFDHLDSVEEMRIASADRIARERIAAAARAYTSRLETFRRTGTMPSASALEAAEVDAVKAAARAEREHWGTEIEKAASSGLKYVALAAAAAIILK
jgi:hypothetical protein